MFDEPRSDYRPLFHLGQWPVPLAGLLVLVHCATMLLCVLLGFPRILIFQSEAVLHGAFWQLGTYAFVNGPSIWFLIEMYLLYTFGRDLERFLGRTRFLQLYLLLLLAPPLLLLLWGIVSPSVLAGSGALHFGIFLAFVTLYPGVMFFFNIPAKWLARALLAVVLLQALAARDFPRLAALLLSAALAWGYIRRVRGLELVPGVRFTFGSPGSTQATFARPVARKERGEDPAVVVDRLLDKISKDGFGSLSGKERAELETARQRMMKRP